MTRDFPILFAQSSIQFDVLMVNLVSCPGATAIIPLVHLEKVSFWHFDISNSCLRSEINSNWHTFGMKVVPVRLRPDRIPDFERSTFLMILSSYSGEVNT